jgi:hypothetical protein
VPCFGIDANPTSTIAAVAIDESERIEATIERGRADADRIVAVAAREGERRIEAAAGAGGDLANGRVELLRDLRRQIEDQQRRIEDGYVTMLEALATTAARLAAAARDADFSVPRRPSGLGRTVEVRLAQTREITFRIEPGHGVGHDSSRSF